MRWKNACALSLKFARVWGVMGCLLLTSGFAIASTTEITYYHANYLGSTMLTSDANGQVVSRHAYAPYGSPVEEACVNPELVRYTFSGKEQDAPSGLFYFEARYYNATIGRFQTPDPGMGGPEFDKTALHRYSYAGNNPIFYTDPSGLHYGTDENGTPELPTKSKGPKKPSSGSDDPKSSYLPPEVPAATPGPAPDLDPVLTDELLLVNSYTMMYEIPGEGSSASIGYLHSEGGLITHKHGGGNEDINNQLRIYNANGVLVTRDPNLNASIVEYSSYQSSVIINGVNSKNNTSVIFADPSFIVPVNSTIRMVVMDESGNGNSLRVVSGTILETPTTGCDPAYKVSFDLRSGDSGGPVFADVDVNGDGDLETVLIGNNWQYVQTKNSYLSGLFVVITGQESYIAQNPNFGISSSSAYSEGEEKDTIKSSSIGQ